VTTQGRNRQERLQIDERQDGRGNAYYWIAYVRMRAQPPADGSDISALADNRIAVTPLGLDMTDEPFMTRRAELFDGGGVPGLNRACSRCTAISILAGCKRVLQHFFEPIHLKRLLEHRPVAIRFGQAALAVAGGEDERRAAGNEGIGHR